MIVTRHDNNFGLCMPNYWNSISFAIKKRNSDSLFIAFKPHYAFIYFDFT